MPTIDATPGGASSNSYATMAEANLFFDQRLLIVPPWVASGDAEARALITAARYLDAVATPLTVFIPPTSTGGSRGYYLTRPCWTGTAATATQRMAWPRLSMFDRNGNPIDPATIPRDLKDAQCEFAGQLLKTDRTLDNDVITQGITAVRAGSVSVNFKDRIDPAVWPQAVWNLLVQSWLTNETIEYVESVIFESLSGGDSPP